MGGNLDSIRRAFWGNTEAGEQEHLGRATTDKYTELTQQVGNEAGLLHNAACRQVDHE